MARMMKRMSMKRKNESRNAKSLSSRMTGGMLVVLMSVSFIFLSGCLWNRTTSHVSCLGYSSEITGFHIWKTERRSAVYIPDFFYIEYFSWPRRGFMPLLGEFLLRLPTVLLEFPYNSEVTYDREVVFRNSIWEDCEKGKAISFHNDLGTCTCAVMSLTNNVVVLPFLVRKDERQFEHLNKPIYDMLFVDTDNNLWVRRSLCRETLWSVSYGEDVRTGDALVMRISLDDGTISPIVVVGEDGSGRLHAECSLKCFAKDWERDFWLYGLSVFLSDIPEN